jgi:hypothetical protein
VHHAVIGRQQHHVEAFGAAQRVDRLAWVCVIGPATLNEVLTEISTPMRRPSAFR